MVGFPKLQVPKNTQLKPERWCQLLDSNSLFAIYQLTGYTPAVYSGMSPITFRYRPCVGGSCKAYGKFDTNLNYC